jgi:ribosome-associated heat shock protein Hsp15
MTSQENTRIDKWLWSVRIFKTRNQASEACRSGKVTFSDLPVKPSRFIQVGDIYQVRHGSLTRKIKVIAELHNRIAAKLVPQFMEDITPVEELERIQMMKELNYERWDRGMGRPTKRHRRLIDKLKGT